LAQPASSMPRVRVAALLVDRDGQVVVVRHRFGASTYHLLPGGGVDFGETLAAALVREVAEETGLECEVGRPVLLNDTIAPDGLRHVVNITFEAHIVGGRITSSPNDDRVEGTELVRVADLERLDLRPPIAAQVREIVERGEAWECTYIGSVFTEDA